MQSKLDFIYPEKLTTGSRSNIGALGNNTLARHRWYSFKEAFSPQIVQLALEENLTRKDQNLIDPFSGSGTSVLSATMKGFNGVGFEVNPFLAFVSSTKLTNCKPATIDKYLAQVHKGIQHGATSLLANFSTFTERKDAKKWLFNLQVLDSFEGGWQATESIPDPARKLIRLCLIGAAMDACNAEKDGKCLRYKYEWADRGYDRVSFTNAFDKRLEIVKCDLKDCPLGEHESKVYLADSRKKNTWQKADQKYKLCVMSPPYLNTFDYTDVYRPELFLGRFVNNHQELENLRLRTLRSHVGVKWANPLEKSYGDRFTESFNKILERKDTLWNAKIPQMVQAYFEDMQQILDNLWKHTMPAAQVWIVVSTSAYAGVEIPVDQIIGDIGEQTGWKLKSLNPFRFLRRTSVQQISRLKEAKPDEHRLRESLIILERTKKKSKFGNAGK